MTQLCSQGHPHFCPEVDCWARRAQHIFDGEFHADCEALGVAHVWSEWHPNEVQPGLVEDRYCDRCGASERQELKL